MTVLVRTVLATLSAALVVVGVAGAANSLSLTDLSGDAKSAPDITGVSVTSDDNGVLTFRVTLANRRTTLEDDDELGVNLDLDQNPDTGSLLYGSEIAMVFEGTELQFLEPDNKNRFMAQVPSPSSFLGGFSNGVATFSIKESDLGLSATGGFNLFALADNTEYTDTAPDEHTANYQLVPGSAAPVLGPDTRPPYDEAFVAHGRRGKVVHLDYSAIDGRAATADTVRVYIRGRVAKTISFDLAYTDPFGLYYAKWLAPRHVRGPLKFCVTSVDAAGNKSNTACAKIVLR